ncbi:hypothetical protein [Burkholderia mayonis]|uniref:hypothetical protein n=1 Tax=Burkholderia mayonis TaxID=1385591 RepID=UPI000B1A91A0|nr:hypothetical protein [Burkholderia mayonis]
MSASGPRTPARFDTHFAGAGRAARASSSTRNAGSAGRADSIWRFADSPIRRFADSMCDAPMRNGRERVAFTEPAVKRCPNEERIARPHHGSVASVSVEPMTIPEGRHPSSSGLDLSILPAGPALASRRGFRCANQ